jgi:uncharacterized protein (DUF427 family)
VKEHKITTRPAAARVQVKYKGELIADSSSALEMHETHQGSVVAPLVYYLPRKDVRMERLARSSHKTHCPFKGDASYYSVAGGADNAVWTYETPYDEMLAIKERLAFYPDKFRVETV